MGRRTSALNRRAPHVGRGTLFFYGYLRHLAHVERWAVYRFNCGFLWEAVSFCSSGIKRLAFTGLLAIILMLFHALWATFVTVRGSEQSRRGFHKLSICVWLIWLIPYCAGLFIGIPVFHFGDAAVLAFSVCIPALIGIVLFMQERKRAC